MTKKKELTKEDKKTWEEYIKNPSDIHDKDKDITSKVHRTERYKFDLHGYTLDEALCLCVPKVLKMRQMSQR